MPRKTKPAFEPRWLTEPEDDNYPAAQSYMSLLYTAKKADRLVAKLRAALVVQFRSKDIFRASGLSLLGVSNSHVERDREKIRKGIELSPILLVRDPLHGRLVVADGYHRLCAIYGFDENAWIHCKLV